MKKIKMPLISENENLKKDYSYTEEHEIDEKRPLGIGIQGPYELMTLNGKNIIISTNLKERYINDEFNPIEWITLKLNNAIGHTYKPFEMFDVDTFLNTVMSINVNDIESILNFYNNYGTLESDKEEGRSFHDDFLEGRNRTLGINVNTTCEELDFFIHEITLLQDLIRIYEAIQSKDELFLRRFKPLNKFVYFFSTEDKERDNIPKEELYFHAKRAIMFPINEHSHLMNSVIELVKGEFIKRTTTTCVLGVFYIRLLELVTENTKIDKCKYCGDYFKPRKAKSNFCPPPEANEKSKCLSRYEAMVRRIADWHFQKGLTVEEIQEKITKPKSRSISEIQYIIDTYNGKLKK